MSDMTRLPKAPPNAAHRVYGQVDAGPHPRHVHPSRKRLAGAALKRASVKWEADRDANGLKREIAAAQTKPHKLSAAGLGWLFEAMFGRPS